MRAILFLYGLGTMADYFITKWNLEHGANEFNNLLALIISNLGIEWILYMKILVLIYVCLTTKAFYKRMPKRVFYITYFVTAVQWLVVGVNVFWARVIMAMF